MDIKVTDDKKCSGCMICALACSFFNKGYFNPYDASIRIERKDYENRFSPRILDDCIGCGMCVEYCHFGVLERD